MDNLKLGYSISLPLNYNIDVPDYTIENHNIIKLLSKKFNCIQIMFTKQKLSSNELHEIIKLIKNYKYIYVHGSYQINIGADLIPSQTDLYNSGIEILINEIILANTINAIGIVVHMGKNVKNKFDPSHIHNNMVKFIIELFNKLKTKKINLKILLETPAGQGGEMYYDLIEFIKFITKFSKLYFYKQIGICLDTCHIFQAGYDLNDSKVIKKIHTLFTPLKNKINLIHLNDSYHQVGERIDRHEQIGKGQIQVNKLIEFIYPYKNIPMILETIGPYEKQINLLKK